MTLTSQNYRKIIVDPKRVELQYIGRGMHAIFAVMMDANFPEEPEYIKMAEYRNFETARQVMDELADRMDKHESYQFPDDLKEREVKK